MGKPSANTGRTEPEVQTEQTPATPTPQAGTSQNPSQTLSIPLDKVMQLLQALNPGINLEETLARLATRNQKTTVPTPQPLPEPTPSSPHQATTSSHPETINKPAETATETKKAGDEEKVEGDVHEDAAMHSEEIGEAEMGVEGERMTESEVIVDAEELQAEREREMKTKAAEEVREIARDGETELGNQEGSDRESKSREATEGREESSGGSDGASDETNEGVGFLESDADTEVVSNENQGRREEECEVVNKEKKEKEKKCKVVMRKSQVLGHKHRQSQI